MPLYLVGNEGFSRLVLNRKITVDAAACAFHFDNYHCEACSLPFPLSRQENFVLHDASYTAKKNLYFGRTLQWSFTRFDKSMWGKNAEVADDSLLEFNNHHLFKKMMVYAMPNRSRDNGKNPWELFYACVIARAAELKLGSIVVAPMRLENDSCPVSHYEEIRYVIEDEALEKYKNLNVYLLVYKKIGFVGYHVHYNLAMWDLMRSLQIGEEVSEERKRHILGDISPFQERLLKLAVHNDEAEISAADRPKRPKPDKAKAVAVIKDYIDKYSQTELAQKAFLSDSTVSKCVHGQNPNQNVKTLVALAVAMGLSKKERKEFLYNFGMIGYPSNMQEKCYEKLIHRIESENGGETVCTVDELNFRIEKVNSKWTLSLLWRNDAYSKGNKQKSAAKKRKSTAKTRKPAAKKTAAPANAENISERER